MDSSGLFDWRHQYGNINITFHKLPSILELRDHLGVKPLNTGNQIYPLGLAGIITDDMEGLHAVCDEHGRARLISGTEFSMYVFRGQTQEHPSCLPQLGRLNTPEAQLLALCQNVAFEDAVAAHPFVRLAEQAAFLGNPLFVDKEGMAQHYGLPTHMLDVTSNFEVASFFATCAWNVGKRQYVPVTDTKHHGVIYRLIPVLLFDPLEPDSAFGPFNIVGWQPLPRPEQQRAFALRMKPGQDFSEMPGVECFKFRHRARISVRIWKAFDEGHALFPADAAAELAVQAESLHQFTHHQIERAWIRMESWTEKTFCAEDRSVIESHSEISKVAVPVLSWDGLDVETDENHLSAKLHDVFSRVRYRMVSPHFCDAT
ncbi:MAG: FRG domain-containing protein [Candidatus Ferrigenium altingense]|jgi:hypothetical protein